MSTTVALHLKALPGDLADAIGETHRDVLDHFLKGEWDDAQVDAGRFCEAVLRYLEWRMTGTFTPIDGKSKPNRKNVIGKAQQDTSLPSSLRAQLPYSIELVMDFRNNRNSAHLGNIDANKMDAACVVQNVTWVVGEIVRLDTQMPPVEVQRLLDQLAARHVPLVQTVNGRPIILNPGLKHSARVLVLLYQQAKPVPVDTLRVWTGHTHSTRFREKVIKELCDKAYVHVDDAGQVTLLYPGEAAAQTLVLDAGGL